MFDPTGTIRRTAAALLACAAAAFVVSTAYALEGPPDAIDRYRAPVIVSDGPPDAIDRYRENQQWVELATARPGFQGSPDAIDRYVGRTAAPAVASTDAGFAWGEFGIGAGAMLGAVLLLVGISLGALAVRHRSGSLRTS